MENAMSVTVTPLQALFAVMFQLWFIVFPIIIIRKINNLTNLIWDHLEGHNESA